MKKKTILEYTLITVGVIIAAFGLSVFLQPNNIAPGGGTGLAIILSELTGIAAGTVFFMMNLPILAIGVWKLGFRFILATLYASTLFSFFMNIFIQVPPLATEPLLAAGFGGAILGIGSGIIFKYGATTGGLDIIVLLTKLKIPHLKSSSIFMFVNVVIIGLSAIVFKSINNAMYAIVAVICISKCMDLILYGGDTAKLVFIISDKTEVISKRLLKEGDIGFTLIQGEGPYSGEEKRVILCAVKKQIYPQLQEIIHQEDPNAFMIVAWATEIFGKNFKEHGIKGF